MGLGGDILFVHADRKAQRQIGRILATCQRRVVTAETLGDGSRCLTQPIALAIVSSHLADGPRYVDFCHEVAATGTVNIVLGEGPLAEILPLLSAHRLCHIASADPVALVDELPVTAQKLLRGDVFGLEKYLTWAAEIRSTTVETTTDRRRALADLHEFLVAIGLSPRHERQATLVADELLSNAIHNAPLDPTGRHYLRDEPRDAHRALEARERPQLRWGYDGRYVAIEVTDQWGTVDGDELRGSIGKLADRGSSPRPGPGGAGLGVAMAYQASSAMIFNLAPGRATQALALIDLRARPDGRRALIPGFHLFEQAPSGATPPATGHGA